MKCSTRPASAAKQRGRPTTMTAASRGMPAICEIHTTAGDIET